MHQKKGDQDSEANAEDLQATNDEIWRRALAINFDQPFLSQKEFGMLLDNYKTQDP
jgi:hypothetical protein